MEITQKAIIIDRIKNDSGQRVCKITKPEFGCYIACDLLVDDDDDILFCKYSYGDIDKLLEKYEDTGDIKPSEFCPMWSE